ncbi:hypothetical protein NNO07_16075 [Pseudomonas resinovorans]|uniref:Uncharacterized protein n=1 Tax=Metapseudomonas resinovorans TaxID=53412 RepID=A0ABT4Y6V1_METRE|nr:hypothetical protein [Pseudomonas resinovorans]MDA8484590.1 hypothetical protein [Pseudomonas resinovorans]
MAVRPIFIPEKDGDYFVRTELVEFEWSPGLSSSQKQKNITKIHAEAKSSFGIERPLEISTKSLQKLGVELSAFNLSFTTKKYNKRYVVESAFQSSKVFLNGGPYTDLIDADPRAAKRDGRLKESGPLVEFRFFGRRWRLEPKTLFYDWLYINSLYQNMEFASEVLGYDAFTDIEFNPDKSINCQAYSAALFVSLCQRNLIEDAISSADSYDMIVTSKKSLGVFEVRAGQSKLL